MTDPYLLFQEVYDRLLREYKEHGSLIIAVDFDDTIYDFHKKGNTYTFVMDLLRRAKRNGCKIVIYTANNDHELVKNYCEENLIDIDGINKQLLPQFEGRGKLYYNILLDDRAGLITSYQALKQVLDAIEGETK